MLVKSGKSCHQYVIYEFTVCLSPEFPPQNTSNLGDLVNLVSNSEPQLPKRKVMLPKPRRTHVEYKRTELDQLLLESYKLETELTQLQGVYQAREQSDPSSKNQNIAKATTAHGYRLIEPRKTVARFVWEEIARHQLKDRWRAQTTNIELRDKLQTEYKLERQMVALLNRSMRAKLADIRVLDDRR